MPVCLSACLPFLAVWGASGQGEGMPVGVIEKKS
ncbi:predicted protein [Plenodomus lingam JN3]|uniref:Predicted protein n=1 Tax=Leptosphaeria maculans (strain JN3 / isolate v23.1.3 / race Av1-4-5-6-7-8) TaxID=985895 RepID=E5A483_LEPMJ|nr:predicted protein [Plenodomus lingam JN3]CBX98428.1 predicted protein [Plenodomus lingam JN3]